MANVRLHVYVYSPPRSSSSLAIARLENWPVAVTDVSFVDILPSNTDSSVRRTSAY